MEHAADSAGYLETCIPPASAGLSEAELAQIVFNSLTAQIAVLDPRGNIIAVNEAWRRFARENGAPAQSESFVGVSYLSACHSAETAAPVDQDMGDRREGAREAFDGIREVLTGRLDQYTLEYPCHSPTEQRWFLLYATPLQDGRGAVIAHINVTERKRVEQELAHQAFHDPLTGLPNRASFHEQLDEALITARQQDRRVAVLFLDLDGFKKVNDTLGHAAGDHLLREVAQRLRGCTRSGDTVARLGGDEFSILLPHIRERENAIVVATKILTRMEAPIILEGSACAVTASIGISLFPDDAAAGADLLERADAAMYQAKRQGKNAYALASDDLLSHSSP